MNKLEEIQNAFEIRLVTEVREKGGIRGLFALALDYKEKEDDKDTYEVDIEIQAPRRTDECFPNGEIIFNSDPLVILKSTIKGRGDYARYDFERVGENDAVFYRAEVNFSKKGQKGARQW